jgi:hypothetical protein
MSYIKPATNYTNQLQQAHRWMTIREAKSLTKWVWLQIIGNGVREASEVEKGMDVIIGDFCNTSRIELEPFLQLALDVS